MTAKSLSNSKILYFLFPLLLLSSLQACTQDKIVKTSNGYLRGTIEDQSVVFKGIPYAQAPIGKLRFKAPQPVLKWTDTLSCLNFGSIAAQPGDDKNKLAGSEDCLTLNLYAPAKSIKSKLPVVVWVHGGGMTGGAGKSQNGHAFSDQDSLIAVTINYRLGVFGFMYMGDNGAYKTSGNNGLLDCIMALKWIKENIASFGGDPSRVTVMGQSAGAKLISTLLISPLAKGYFNQLILESGSVQCIRDTATAKAIRKRLLNTLQLTQPNDLLKLTTTKLINAQDEVCGGARGTNYFGPVQDGIVINEDPYTYIKAHAAPAIRILTGTNTAESKMFMNADKRLFHPDETVLKDWFGNPYSFILSGYQKAIKNGSSDAITRQVLTQYMYQMHSYRLIDALAENGYPTWTYRFNYSTDLTGADHAAELKYVWYLPHNQQYNEEETQLALQIHQRWVNFIKGKNPDKTGGPAWPRYQNQHPVVMLFDQTVAPVQLKEIYNDKAYPTAGFSLN